MLTPPSLAALASLRANWLIAITVDETVVHGFVDEQNFITWEHSCPIVGLPAASDLARARIFRARNRELYLTCGRRQFWRMDAQTGRLESVGVREHGQHVTFEMLLDVQGGVALFMTKNGCLARGPLRWNGEAMRLDLGDSELLSNGWSRFTRLFPGMGYVFAESCTGEGVWYATDRLAESQGRPDRPVVGEAILCAGFRSFSSIAPVSDGSFFGCDASGALFDFRLEGGLDSDGRRARECVGTRLGNGAGIAGPCGYSWPICASRGETITFFVSSAHKYRLEMIDLVSDEARDPLETGAEWFEPSIQQFAGSESSACDWKTTFRFVVPKEWPSSIWSARLSAENDRSFDIVFVTKPSTSAASCPALVLASTNTWNAYNSWGGASKYGPVYTKSLSFLRPNPAASPIWDGYPNHLLVSDLWIIRTLQTLAYDVEFISDWEMETEPEYLANAKVLILLSHPEYWSHRMRDNLEHFLANGGSLLYLGGNGLFELCSIESEGTELKVFPVGDPPLRLPSLFRNLAPPRPERPLLGVAFRFDVDWKADPLTHLAGSYTVVEASHWAFEGCGLEVGDLIGTRGRNAGGACGWEMDTSAPGLSGAGIVSARGSDDRGSSPESLRVLARGIQVGGQSNNYGADMTIYQHPGGGQIFSAGSICFGGSLVEDRILQMIICNVLDHVTK